MNPVVLDQAPTKFSLDHAGVAGKLMEDCHGFFRIGPEGRDWQKAPQNSLYIAVVADGSVSTQAGANASHLAIQIIEHVMQEQPSDMPVLQRIGEAMRTAHKSLLDAALQNPALRGMSTSLAIAVVDGWRLYVSHMGDCRVYLVRDGILHPLTIDHTVAQEALDARRISVDDARQQAVNQTPLRYLGMEKELHIDHAILLPGSGLMAEQRRMESSVELQPGDGVLLCTDGLVGHLSDEEIAEVFNRQRARQALRQIVDLAVERREEDNITVALLTMPQAQANRWTSGRSVDVAALLIAAILAFLLLAVATWSGNAIGQVAGWNPMESISVAVFSNPATSTPAAQEIAATANTSDTLSAAAAPTATQTATVEPTAAPTATIKSAQVVSDSLAAAAAITTTAPITATEIVSAAVASTPPLTDSLAISDSLVLTDSPTLAGATALTDAVVLTDSVALTDSLQLTAAVALSDAVLSSQMITATDVFTLPSQTPTLTATVAAAANETEVPTLTTSPTVTESPVPTVGELATSLATPTATKVAIAVVLPTLPSTATGTATATAAAPATATATTPVLPTETATLVAFTPTSTTPPQPNLSVTLLEPTESTLAGTYTFRWAATGTLPPDHAYELIFWDPALDPLARGFSPVGANQSTSVRVDLNTAALGPLQGVLMPGRTYKWSVALVDLSRGGQRVIVLSSGLSFLFKLEEVQKAPAPKPTDTPQPPPPPTNTPVPPPPATDTPVPPPTNTPVPPPPPTDTPVPAPTEECPRTDPNCKG